MKRNETLVFLSWLDACLDERKNDNRLADGGIPTVSMGFLVAENINGVTIAMSLDDDGEYSDLLTVPHGIIESMIKEEFDEDDTEPFDEKEGTSGDY